MVRDVVRCSEVRALGDDKDDNTPTATWEWGCESWRSFAARTPGVLKAAFLNHHHQEPDRCCCDLAVGSSETVQKERGICAGQSLPVDQRLTLPYRDFSEF